MSWFQSVRDDLTLRPFELQHTRSDSAAMASGPPDVSANQEPAEVVEECTGKKKSKFQTFKKFFARKKRKEPPAPGADARIKASQSSDNVSKTSENNTLTRSEKDKGSGSKISLGSKALSHDSVFVSDSSEANEALGASQDSIHGKVKSLQLQLKQAIKLGSPPSLTCVKRTEDAGTMSEDDGLPCSPPEYTTPHMIMNQAQRNSSISLEGIESDDNQLSCAASSRAVSPLVVPGDFSQPASPFGCLDNSAAKHKLGLRNKACNKRKPISRFEIKAEESVVEKRMNNSIMEALEEQQKTTEVLNVDELKPKVEREDESEDEEEEVEEEEEKEQEQPQHSRKSMLSEKEEGESDAEQEVSHNPDASSSPELSEEETTDAQPPPSSKTSSRTSSLDSPRATPEPPAGPTEYSPNPPGFIDEADAYMAESDLRGEENEVQDNIEEEETSFLQDNIEEEETSFLQEVLNSLKTPLVSCSLDTETECVVQDIEEEVKEQGGGDLEAEEDEEVRKEEVEVNQPASYRAAPVGFILSHQATEGEEEVDPLNTCAPVWQHVEDKKVEDKEEEAAVEEEEKDHDDDDDGDDDEELVVEQFSHGKKEEGEEVGAEEVNPGGQNNMLTGNTVNQAKKERGREEVSEGGEEDAVAAEEPEKEPEVEEEGRESWEVVEVKAAKERAEDTKAAAEEEERDDAGETIEVIPGVAAEEVKIAMALQEEDEGEDVVIGDNTMFTPQHADDDESPPELGDQAHEGQEASHQIFAEEREDGEEVEEEEGERDHTKGKSEQEEDGAVNQPEPDQTEEDVEREGMEISYLDLRQEEKDQTDVPSKPPPLSLPESYDENPSEESGAISPSQGRTTTLHINLLSPSSKKVTPFFQQSPTAQCPKESETPSHAMTPTEQNTASAEEEAVETVQPVEPAEENQSALEKETPPASVEDTVNQPSSRMDQSKVCFTIATAWQRSLSAEDADESLTLPSSPPAGISSSSSAVTESKGVEVEATTKEDPQVKAEVMLSPGRVRNAGTTIARPQSSATSLPSPVKPQTPAAASSEGSSVVVEGNPENPFGIRLRKTSVLRRFSSVEENTEPPIEPQAQATSCKVDPPQPISVKPSIIQPVSNRPALPKKPGVHGDSAGKHKRFSDPRGASGGSDSPSWISVAKQKQKIYKESSLEEITVKKEEHERKSSLPVYVSSAASSGIKTAESTSKVSLLEINKPSVSVQETKRVLSPPTPVPSQPPNSQSLHYPLPPKPQVPPATTKHPSQRSLSPLKPVPFTQKSPSCTSPPSLSKTATPPKMPQPQSMTVTSPPFSSSTAPEKCDSRVPGLYNQAPSSQRGLPAPALPQDEPPWMALAKKKAKAWSEMPQIVQ